MKKYMMFTIIALWLNIFISPLNTKADPCLLNPTPGELPLIADIPNSSTEASFTYSFNRSTNQLQINNIWIKNAPQVYLSFPNNVMVEIINKLLESSFDILAITDSSVSHNIEIVLPRCWKAYEIMDSVDGGSYWAQPFHPCTIDDCCRAIYTVQKRQGMIRICDKVQTSPSGLPCGSDIDPTNPAPCTSICDALMQVRTYEELYQKSCDAIINPCDNPCFWQTNGNSDITDDNFIGPTNGKDFIIKTLDSTNQNLNEVIRVTNYGYVGVGTSTPTEKLDIDGNLRVNGEARILYPAYFDENINVKGIIKASEVLILNPTEFWPWPDYVFSQDYKLRSLAEVESYIKQNNSLPEMPNKDEVKENGVKLNEMQALLLKKIEEMTLYMIELKKENEALKQKMDELEKKQESNK